MARGILVGVAYVTATTVSVIIGGLCGGSVTLPLVSTAAVGATITSVLPVLAMWCVPPDYASRFRHPFAFVPFLLVLHATVALVFLSQPLGALAMSREIDWDASFVASMFVYVVFGCVGPVAITVRGLLEEPTVPVAAAARNDEERAWPTRCGFLVEHPNGDACVAMQQIKS